MVLTQVQRFLLKKLCLIKTPEVQKLLLKGHAPTTFVIADNELRLYFGSALYLSTSFNRSTLTKFIGLKFADVLSDYGLYITNPEYPTIEAKWYGESLGARPRQKVIKLANQLAYIMLNGLINDALESTETNYK